MKAYGVHVPVAPTAKTNSIQVTVDYEKDRDRGIHLWFSPCWVADHMVRVELFDPEHKTSREVLLPLARLDKKKLYLLADAVKQGVESRQGAYWDKIAAFAASRGLEIQREAPHE